METFNDFELNGVVSENELKKPVDENCKAGLECMEQALKDKPGDMVARLGHPLKTRDEAVKKVKYMKEQKALLGSAYDKYVIKFAGSEEAGYQPYGQLAKPSAGEPGKPKGAKRGPKPGGSRKTKTAAGVGGDIAALPLPESVKELGRMGNKAAIQQIKAAVESPTPERAPQYEEQLKAMGLTKEQYIALLDEELK